MIHYARIYSFYSSLFLKILRIVIFLWLSGLIYLSLSFEFSLTPSSTVPIFFLSVFLMWEVFFRFKVVRMPPPILVKDNDGANIYNSFTLEALSIFAESGSSINIIKMLLNKSQIIFILQKADFTEKDVPLIEISKGSIANLAFENCKSIKSKYVTTMDIFTAYILLTEDRSQLLFNKELKKEELINILYWAKNTNSQEENDSPFKIKFEGEGMGEGWVTGWTLETGKHMSDITSDALNKKPMFLGREDQYSEVIAALSKNRSVLLVGEPGSGKRSLVNALAFESFAGRIKGNLYHQRFYQVLIDSLLAGIQNQGQLEERLNNIISEISHSGNVMVFIPNFENILGASSFNTDLSGALIPYLEKGIIRIIASITPGSYEKFVEPKHTLASVFEIVKFEEPDKEAAFRMLLRKTPEIESSNKIAISYKAIVSVSNLALKYLQDRAMPGSAVRLLEDTASAASLSGKKIVEAQDVIDKVEAKSKIAVGAPSEEERNLLLHLEDELSKYIVGQKDAIFGVSEALRRVRTGLNDKEKPISFLFLGPTGVGKTHTAKALSKIYFKGEDKMIRFDMSEYSTEESVRRFLGGLTGANGITDAVREHPFSLVLLDEFEKSSPKIIDLFLQVLDDGRLTDNMSRTVSFTDTIIIATSNAASEYIREEIAKKKTVDSNFQKNLLEVLQGKGIFRPEFLNRFDGIIVFKPLGQAEILQIVGLMLAGVSRKLQEKDIVVSFDEKATEKIAREGFDEQFGARPLARFIQDNIENLLAQKILKEEIKRGNKVLVSANDANIITVTVS